MAAIYGRCRIGFNYSIANDVNMRIFEILAAGTLLVTNALAGDDLRGLGLEDRAHLVLYQSPPKLFKLLNYFLAHPEECHRIAETGHRRAMERHTYAHRMRQILAAASERFGSCAFIQEPALLDPAIGPRPSLNLARDRPAVGPSGVLLRAGGMSLHHLCLDEWQQES